MRNVAAYRPLPRLRLGLGVIVLALLVCSLASAAASAAPAPAWTISSVAAPTNFNPGAPSGESSYEVTVLNSGGAPTDGGPVTIRDTLPPGLTVEAVELELAYEGVAVDFGPELCATAPSPDGEGVTCTVPSAIPPPSPPSSDKPALLYPSEAIRLVIRVSAASLPEGQTLINRAEVEGGGASAAAVTSQNEAGSQPAATGFEEFSATLSGADGSQVGEAASHPHQLTISFALNTKRRTQGGEGFVPAGGNTKDIQVALPPGLLANPRAVPRCTGQEFSAPLGTDCPDSSAIGILLLRQVEGAGALTPLPLYNLVAPPGMPAQFGFQIANLPFYVNTRVRTGSDYGLTAELANLTEVKGITAATLTLWGEPGDPLHDPLRGHCLSEGIPLRFSLGSCPADPGSEPFLRLPSSCRSPLDTVAAVDAWPRPGIFVTQSSTAPPPTGCASLEFSPVFDAGPASTVADSPTGLGLRLHLPQEGESGRSSPDLRDLTLRLPAGLVVNPATAAGLAGCSPAEVGLVSAPGAPPRFSTEQARCPDAAKIGAARVETPLLDHRLEGGVYVAEPGQNPFGSLLAVYLVATDPVSGVVLKLPGRIEADSGTGRLTVHFADNPQLPVADLDVRLFDGPRAALRTPLGCGAYAIAASLTPWSAPESGPPQSRADSFAVASAPGGARCATDEAGAPNAPSFLAGTLKPIAGSFAPLSIEVSREDGSQRLGAVGVSLPPGLLARLAGTPSCAEAAVAAVATRTGKAELAHPSCPAASEVGVVGVGAGSGPRPIYLDGGRVYLAGPYKGAPLSLAVVVPAVAGPFDLGTVVIRLAIHVDPVTAQLHVAGDPLPAILRGIPLDLRSLRIELDRPGFVVNPTSCEEMSVGGEIASATGAKVVTAYRFQVGGCSELGFEPKLSMRLLGRTGRGSHPRLRATLKSPRSGEANIRRVAFALPASELLDSRRIAKVCTRAEFAARRCPMGSAYGRVRAWTPLLDRPLSGRVFLRESDNRLPDLAVALGGEVDLNLSGRIDSSRGRLRIVFPRLPDVPFSKLVLNMPGGKRGLLANTGGLCSRRWRVAGNFNGQNGKRHKLHPLVKTACGKRR